MKACLFSWGGNQYSVSAHLARKKVKLHVYEDRLEVYFSGKQVATLPRLAGKGQRLIQDEHYADRSAGPRSKQITLQQRFEAIGPVAQVLLKGLAQSKSGSLREQAESILGLCEAYDNQTVYAAMEQVADFGNYSYKAVRRILLRRERAPESLPQQPTQRCPWNSGR